MPERTCSIPGCKKPHKALGWCNVHYLRWHQHGDPLIVTNPHGALEERFWPKVDRSAGDAGCWPWTAQRDRAGYGVIAAGGERGTPLRAHRVAYEMLVGPIPDGLVMDHLCRNTSCVNPPSISSRSRRLRTCGAVSRAPSRPIAPRVTPTTKSIPTSRLLVGAIAGLAGVPLTGAT